MFADGPRVKETRQIRSYHYESVHPRSGIQNGPEMHCPLMNCGFICPTLEAFEDHCERRHFHGGGTQRCDDCCAAATPFSSKIKLVKHRYLCHGEDRFKKREREMGTNTVGASNGMVWIISQSDTYGDKEMRRPVKKMKYK